MTEYQAPDTSEFAGVIYALHNGDHEYRYIGQTINLDQRFKRHLYDARSGKGYAVHRWIRKHDPENIQVCILATVQEHELEWLDSLEIFHIAQYRDLIEQENLNLKDGGGSNGYRPTEETRKKMSAARKGRVVSDRAKEVASLTHKGKTVSPETRAKISKANKGRSAVRSQAFKDNLSAQKRGKPIIAPHVRFHINRNQFKDGCTFCDEETLMVSLLS